MRLQRSISRIFSYGVISLNFPFHCRLLVDPSWLRFFIRIEQKIFYAWKFLLNSLQFIQLLFEISVVSVIVKSGIPYFPCLSSLL